MQTAGGDPVAVGNFLSPWRTTKGLDIAHPITQPARIELATFVIDHRGLRIDPDHLTGLLRELVALLAALEIIAFYIAILLLSELAPKPLKGFWDFFVFGGQRGVALI